MFNWLKKSKQPKKKARGMFDPIGLFEIQIHIAPERAGDPNIRVSRWINFYAETLANKLDCARCHILDGVHTGGVFYPAHRVLSVYMTGKQRNHNDEGE